MPFDAAANGRFDLAMPPAGWTSLGWISDFKRVSATKYVPVRAGVQEQVSVQVRTAPDAHVQFQFREWGKLQLAIACGTQHLNLLDVQAAAALQPGSTASALNLDAASLTKFQAGDVVAVDVDYQQQTGYVGTGIPAAFVAGAQAAQLHADYVRRVTYNVAKVASVTQAQLVLDLSRCRAGLQRHRRACRRCWALPIAKAARISRNGRDCLSRTERRATGCAFTIRGCRR